MTVEEKSSQVLMTGIDGKTSFSASMRRHFDGVVPGAVLLFRFNIGETPREVSDYLASCTEGFAALKAPVPVLFAIDHEGGAVYRMGKVTTRLPSASAVASGLSAKKSEDLYRFSGKQLSLLGIKLNLAPIAEILTPENQPFLGSRAYSASKDIAQLYALSALSGYRQGGILTVLKHFPGNGSGDPHAWLSTLNVSSVEFEKTFVAPFRFLVKQHPDAVLVSHIIVPAVEPLVPFCFSYKGVTGLLRRSLGFKGLILTDDIAMGAIAKNGYSTKTAAILALKAGCDMVMVSDPDIRSVANAIASEARGDSVFAKRLDEAVTRILEMKYRAGLVKNGAERYSDSSRAEVFDEQEFDRMRTLGDRILEEIK